MYKKGGRKVSRVQVDDTSLKDKEYLRFEVLEGEVGNSFYGSRLGSSFRCSVEVWFCGTGFYGYMVCGFLGKSSMITTTATSTTTTTTTATAERPFETLRVYGSSTTTTTATSTATITTTAKRIGSLRFYGFTSWYFLLRIEEVLRFVGELGSFQQGRLYLLSIFP